MTREEAKMILFKLINSGILDDELEEKLSELADHICADDFKDCVGDEYCEGCKFKQG